MWTWTILRAEEPSRLPRYGVIKVFGVVGRAPSPAANIASQSDLSGGLKMTSHLTHAQ